MPRLPLFARFPTSSTQRRCCIWRGCTALRRACLARRPELCRRPTLALQRRAVHRSYRHFQGCLSNLKRDKFPRQLLHPNSMRFRSKPYRSLCGTANVKQGSSSRTALPRRCSSRRSGTGRHDRLRRCSPSPLSLTLGRGNTSRPQACNRQAACPARSIPVGWFGPCRP